MPISVNPPEEEDEGAVAYSLPKNLITHNPEHDLRQTTVLEAPALVIFRAHRAPGWRSPSRTGEETKAGERFVTTKLIIIIQKKKLLEL